MIYYSHRREDKHMEGRFHFEIGVFSSTKKKCIVLRDEKLKKNLLYFNVKNAKKLLEELKYCIDRIKE